MTALRWCTWHGGLAEGVILVRIIETGSGPGGMLYACPRCRVVYGLELLDDPVADTGGTHPPRRPPDSS